MLQPRLTTNNIRTLHRNTCNRKKKRSPGTYNSTCIVYKQQQREQFLQSRVRDAHEAHFFNATAVELTYCAVLVSLLLRGRIPRLGAVKQLICICNTRKGNKK